jgi:hypothetical protein
MYPKQIKDYSISIADEFKKWSKQNNVDHDIFAEFLKKFISEKVLPRWLDNGETILDESELKECLDLAWIEYLLDSLRKKGMVDSIEDNNGEEIWFATKKGKEYI